MVEESWWRKHGGTVMAGQSLSNSHGGKIIMEESWWKSHGGIVTLDHSFNINGGTVMVEQLW